MCIMCIMQKNESGVKVLAGLTSRKRGEEKEERVEEEQKDWYHSGTNQMFIIKELN